LLQLADARAFVVTVFVMWLRRALVVLLVAGTSLAASPRVSAEEDPFLTNDAPPRVVEIAGSATDVQLLDSQGVLIPLTGAGAELVDGIVTIYPPRLPAGTYTVTSSQGESTFTVGAPEQAARREAASAARSPSPLRWLLVAIPLLPAIVLVIRHRRARRVRHHVVGHADSSGGRRAGRPVCHLGTRRGPWVRHQLRPRRAHQQRPAPGLPRAHPPVVDAGFLMGAGVPRGRP
jgi:hypothetical protein